MSLISLVENAVRRSSFIHQVDDARVRLIIEDFLKSLHQTAFKGSATQALHGVYIGLGDEAAWHFFGLIHSCLEGGDPDTTRDSIALWNETAKRLDGRMARFSGILDQWTEEKEYEEEQKRLDLEDTNGK
jgi:hypothetical protein